MGRDARAKDREILARAKKLLAEVLESVFVPDAQIGRPVRREVARVDRFPALHHFVPLMARISDTDRAFGKARLQLVRLFRETGGNELRIGMRG